MEYSIDDIMAQIRLCLQSVISGNKKMVMENDALKVTVYQMGTLSHIRIDIEDAPWPVDLIKYLRKENT